MEHMNEKMDCMCLECGILNYLPEGDILMEDPASSDSKILDSLLACQICGGQLILMGKIVDEPFNRLE